MIRRIAKAGFFTSLRFSLGHMLPIGLQGTFQKRPFMVKLLGRLHRDPLGKRFVQHLKDKYHCSAVELSMLGRRTILVLDPQDVAHVLARSPLVYADPRAKREGMSIFQPNAVTISRGADWNERRAFNDAVLSTALTPPYDAHVLESVRAEVRHWFATKPTRLTWADLAALYQHITLRIIFGTAARDHVHMVQALDTLLRRANRLLFKKRQRRAWETLNTAIAGHLANPQPNSLCAIAASLQPSANVQAVHQVPHWLFAMKDTLALNTAAALALLTTHPDADCTVARTLATAPPLTPATIHNAAPLRHVIHEAMRLWPTTPLLLRETLTPDTLAGTLIEPGTQVLLWNAANHRDPDMVPDPDAFRPERFADPTPNWFNHLSNGPQGCAGRNLAVFITQCVLAELTTVVRLRDAEPRLSATKPLPEAFNWFAFEATVAPHNSAMFLSR